MKDLIDYQLPFANSKLPTTHIPKRGNNYIAHAHFIKGKRVYDRDCNLCRGVKKPPKSPEEIAEKKRLKIKYFLDWKEKQEQEEIDNLSPEDKHLSEIMKYG